VREVQFLTPGRASVQIGKQKLLDESQEMERREEGGNKKSRSRSRI
jgi:hypothetical protein